MKLSLYLILGVFFRDVQITGVRSLGRINFVRRRQSLWLLSMDLASYHPSGGRNFEVASAFLKKFCPHVSRNKNRFMYLKLYLNFDPTEQHSSSKHFIYLLESMNPEIYSHNAEIGHFHK